jgi:hypothetical protein
MAQLTARLEVAVAPSATVGAVAAWPLRPPRVTAPSVEADESGVG